MLKLSLILIIFTKYLVVVSRADECPADQELLECPDASCFPLTCDEVGYAIPGCGKSSPCPGDPDCVCKDGNVFDDCGNCIPPSQCPSCGGDENAVQGCGNNCGKKCSDLVTKQSFCTLSCKLNGCDCKDNFYYDSNKERCVPAKECTSICTGPNEEYVKCPDCSPQTCATRNNIYHCPMIPANKTGPNCTPACRCKKGYFKNSKNICVAACECDDCPKDQVYSKCPDASCAALTCAEAGYEKKNCGKSDPCPGQPGCVCKGGYLKDANGNCIQSSQCPSCGGDKNAIPGGCGNYCGRKCTDIGKNGTTICPPACILNGCACKPNYWYDTNTKKCVKASECTNCPPNEHYEKCVYSCPPRTCESLDKAYVCPIRNGSEPPCKPGCKCDDGYYRNAQGKCVTEAECRKCPGQNEVLDPCPSCAPQTCATRNVKYYCTLNVACKPACRCIKGFYRNYKGKCVPACDCEKCPKNEVFSKCPTATCGPLTCAEAGYEKKNCGGTKPCAGDPGCVCKKGYLRDAKGVCIPSDHCPSCGGDAKAIPGCGNPCGKTCADIGRNETMMCTQYCLPNGCDCRKKYIYDDNRKACVKPKDCTPTCKKNEEFNNCANGPCRPQECKDKGKKWSCPPMLPDSCVPGCSCKKNFLRKNGDCVPEYECDKPSPIKCKKNEQFDNCANVPSYPQECKDKDKIWGCPTVLPGTCRPGCLCEKNHLRKNGTCVLEDECDEPCLD